MATLDRVQDVIADALYVDKEEVSVSANLMKDLGAESIDFLDIMFRLEKEFDIKIPKGEVEKKARGHLTEDEYAVNGRLSELALERLKVVMPEIDHSLLTPGLLVRDIPSLFTVQTFVAMVDDQLSGGRSVGVADVASSGANA